MIKKLFIIVFLMIGYTLYGMEAVQNPQEAFFEAIKNNNEELVRDFIRKGVDLEKKDKSFGATPYGLQLIGRT